MKITKVVINYLNKHISENPPETGGILGSVDGETISEIILDIPQGTQYNCCYFPNVNFLNSCLRQWSDNQIYFMGIFHTHFANVQTHSKGDISYITTIMNAMPHGIEELYFPIYVLPDRKLICYKAMKNKTTIDISKEDIEIIA